MARRDEFNKMIEQMGACVYQPLWEDRINLTIDAPRGYVWRATDEPSIVCGIGSGCGAMESAYADAVERMALGIRAATPEESVAIEYDRDEPWTA